MSKKLGGSHTSIIDPAKDFMKEAKKLRSIKKIVPGIISSIRATGQRVRLKPGRGHVLVEFISKRYLQEIRFYGDDPERIKKELEEIGEELMG